jgi:imidazolonepropionase-like amidohydrolase
VEPCGCSGYTGALTLVADGVDAVRRAAREELRKGATQIKLHVSGGVLSPTDPIWMPQFTDEEIRAAVHEASTRRTYVMAHCLTDEGARRCVESGVRSIEHGTLITEDTARLVAAKKAFVVPTLSVVDVLRKHAPDLGLPPLARKKVAGIYESYAKSIEACTRAGVKIGLGSDLLGQEFHPLQGGELALRAEFNRPIDVLRSATSVNAELLQMSGQLGCIQPNAYADLLVTKGDPLKDPGLFREPLGNLLLIMKGGACVRSAL